MIHIQQLTKKFGSFTALDTITTSVPAGEITAIIGPNASGKTTLLKSIVGLIPSFSGSILVSGTDISGKSEYRAKIGYMPQFPGFPENLTVGAVVQMVKDLRSDTNTYNEELFERFQLSKETGKKIKTLSGGTRQKLSAYITFLFQPELVILDEPTASLDPVASTILKEVILKQKASGTTMVMTSHNIHELEEIASNLIFLLDGKLKYTGTVDGLKEVTGEESLERAIAFLIQQNGGNHAH